MESRNASFFENIFPCLTNETGSSSRIYDKIFQDKIQRDDNAFQVKRQDQPGEEDVEPRKSKRVRTKKSDVDKAAKIWCLSNLGLKGSDRIVDYMDINDRAVDNREKLYMGNSANADIKGEGDAILKMTSKKELKLTNVVCSRDSQESRVGHEFTAPYSPQQSGIAERKNRTLKEMVNIMLISSGLSENIQRDDNDLQDESKINLGKKRLDLEKAKGDVAKAAKIWCFPNLGLKVNDRIVNYMDINDRYLKEWYVVACNKDVAYGFGDLVYIPLWFSTKWCNGQFYANKGALLLFMKKKSSLNICTSSLKDIDLNLNVYAKNIGWVKCGHSFNGNVSVMKAWTECPQLN
ncbi:retrotransposon protein, putative, ty1-copia subclass [Tanacetum coccineum]